MTLYVCGHRNPDADSILSAVATAELCRLTGHAAVACRAGSDQGTAHDVACLDISAVADSDYVIDKE